MAENNKIKRARRSQNQQNVEVQDAEPGGNMQPGAEETSMAQQASLQELNELLRQTRESTLEGMRLATAPVLVGPLAAVAATDADITDELEKGGPAFGAFVKAVGLAVADAQQKLDETLVTTAKALSDTKIKVVAIFEQEINDDGQMTQGNAVMQDLPLINYLMPTAYQWTRVYLEADMKVQEFNGANGFNIKGQSTSFTAGVSGSAGLFGASISGDTRFSTGSYSQNAESSFARDQAAGSLHMEATLEPRSDIQLPRPFILQKGPRLQLTANTRTDILSTDTPPKVIGRKITLTAQLYDKANNVLAGKLLECRISEPLLNYTKTPADSKTDTTGQLKIEITRTGAAFDEKKPPEPVIVNVWLGLVNQQVVINV